MKLSTALGVSAAVLGLMLTGCADTRGGTIPYNVSLAAPDAPTVSALPADYKIAPMDTLTVKVFRVQDLSGDYQVDLLGNIAMPLVGDVPAAGRTPEQLSELLRQKLGAKYLQNPDISVAIKSSAGRNVTVDGAVTRAGAYPVLSQLTLIQAVALAGGTTDDANAHRVAIFRTIDGKRQAASFDLTSIRHGQMPDPPVYAGDIVVVDGSSIKAAEKQIFQSFPFLSIFRPF
jgi:polysaccharide biosynthesis/export protein